MFMSGNKRLFPRYSKRIAYGTDIKQRREIEKNLDPFLRTQFHAGLDESFAKQLKLKLMKKDLFITEIQPKQILYIDNDNNRFMKDDTKGVYIHERKEKLKSYDISLLSHDYDLRIACATEIIHGTTKSLNNGNNSGNPSSSFQERHKYRTSFQLIKNSKWKIDYTEVITQNPSSSSSGINNDIKKYELEFEMKKEVLVQWLQLAMQSSAMTSSNPEAPPTPSPELRKLTDELFHELKYLLDYCIPSEIDSSGEVELKPCEVQLSLQLTPHIQDCNRIVKPTTSSSSIEFLGSMPINLFRSSLANVLQSDYFLTEKTDGVRYLLYILPHPQKPSKQIAIFMNRSKELFQYNQSELLGSCFPVNTIIDGEIVYNHYHKKSVFLIFDILSYDSNSFIHHNFQQRYQFIKDKLIDSFHKNMKQSLATLPTPSVPPTNANNTSSTAATPGGSALLELLVHYKKFVPKQNITDLLKLFRIENGERIYYENDLRYHKSDGIIFQPNTAYVFSKYYDLLKWKWSDLRSIDLKIQIPSITTSMVYSNPSLLAQITSKDINLLCTGPNSTLINISKRGDYNVGLGFYDSGRLLIEIEELLKRSGGSSVIGGKHLDNIIIEVIYDVQVGKWIYSKIRYDKNEPNYIDSVLGVFIEQAEAISIEELEFTIIASVKKYELDYDTHLNKMKNNILEWQRNRK